MRDETRATPGPSPVPRSMSPCLSSSACTEIPAGGDGGVGGGDVDVDEVVAAADRGGEDGAHGGGAVGGGAECGVGRVADDVAARAAGAAVNVPRVRRAGRAAGDLQMDRLLVVDRLHGGGAAHGGGADRIEAGGPAGSGA